MYFCHYNKKIIGNDLEEKQKDKKLSDLRM